MYRVPTLAARQRPLIACGTKRPTEQKQAPDPDEANDRARSHLLDTQQSVSKPRELCGVSSANSVIGMRHACRLRQRGSCDLYPCLSGRLVKPPPPVQVWETARLGWWDFQKRRLQSTWLAQAVCLRVREALSRFEALEEAGKTAEAEEMWREVNALSAREIRKHAEDSKGLFVKATQQMSMMVGVLPDVYIDEFVRTTEGLAISSPEEVYAVIERDLLCPPPRVFRSFDREPVASASIGQVHKARLCADGALVAVKVQHDGVGRVFAEDLGTLRVLADMVAYWVPDLDFRAAVAELSEVVPRELDFREECRSLGRARAALLRAGSPVMVPIPVEPLCGREVLVMSYVDAWPIQKLADEAFCRAHGLRKEAVMRDLLDAFGTLVFQEGLVHGDPHVGSQSGQKGVITSCLALEPGERQRARGWERRLAGGCPPGDTFRHCHRVE